MNLYYYMNGDPSLTGIGEISRLVYTNTLTFDENRSREAQNGTNIALKGSTTPKGVNTEKQFPYLECG